MARYPSGACVSTYNGLQLEHNQSVICDQVHHHAFTCLKTNPGAFTFIGGPTQMAPKGLTWVNVLAQHAASGRLFLAD